MEENSCDSGAVLEHFYVEILIEISRWDVLGVFCLFICVTGSVILHSRESHFGNVINKFT
jgi:hypothetical protein